MSEAEKIANLRAKKNAASFIKCYRYQFIISIQREYASVRKQIASEQIEEL